MIAYMSGNGNNRFSIGDSTHLLGLKNDQKYTKESWGCRSVSRMCV